MNYYKQLRKNRKKEEVLPSFLVGLTDTPEDITLAPKPHPSTHYLGPIFVGLCTNYQHHPPPHSLKLGSFHQPQFIMLPGSDDISKLLYTQSKVDKITQTTSVKKRQIKHPKIYHDIYPHKCTGSKRMFIPDITPHVINLGKTQSIIEGEASIEIPLSRSHVPLRYRRKSTVKRENDFITLSDIREERRKYMSYKERIAHAHFPKEFTTVRVIGPPIPASITITKLPTKRRTESQFNLELKSDTLKVEIAEETEKTTIKSIKPKPRKTSKKFSTKSIDQGIEAQEKVEEETEIRGEVYDEFSAGEEEEIYGEGFEEIEWEKRESEGTEKEEEDATAEEREERGTLVKEESKAEDKERTTLVKEESKAEERDRTTLVKEESKAEERDRTTLVKEESKAEERERTTLVKEEPKAEERERTTLVKEEPKAEERERTTLVKEEQKAGVKEEPKAEERERTTLVKEEQKAGVKEEPKAGVKEEKIKAANIKQEEAVSGQKAKGTSATSATSATSRKESEDSSEEKAKGTSSTSASSRKETDTAGERTTSKSRQEAVK